MAIRKRFVNMLMEGQSMAHLVDGALCTLKRDELPCHGNVWWDLNDWSWLQKPTSTTMCHVIPTKRYSTKKESLKIMKDWTERKER